MEELFFENAEIENGVLLKYELDRETLLEIPEGITEIAEDAIEDGYFLKTVKLPDSLAVLDSSAFNNCCYISEFILSETNPHFTFDGNALFNKDKTVLIKVLPTLKGHYDIPDTVVTVGRMAFYECDVTSVTFPDSVKVIGKEAFCCCGALTDVHLPESLREIGKEAFDSCDNLTAITIPEGVTTLGWAAFSGCDNLASVTLPGTLTTIGGCAFSHCDALASVTIPEGVSTIGTWAFRGCKNLTSVTIPASVTAIGDWEDPEHEKPTIYAVPDSFAWQWAQQQNFPVAKLIVKPKRGVCPHCGGKLNGLLFKKCVSCGKRK